MVRRADRSDCYSDYALCGIAGYSLDCESTVDPTLAAPGMTVDSEAIFALAERERSRAHVLEELYGSMATAWLDQRDPQVLFLARGVGRPLWLGEGRHELFFASTKSAL